MTSSEISLASVNFGNETFRIREDLDLPTIIASIKAIGQQNPVLLLESGSAGNTIVCGFRRLHALRGLGAPSARAVIIPETACSPVQAFGIALWDNMAHCRLNALEKARVLFALKKLCLLDDDTLIKVYLPLLGLEPNRRALNLFLSIHECHPQLRVLHIGGSLTLSSIERLARMPGAVQNEFCKIFARIRMSASLQRQFLDVVQDLAAVAGIGIPEVLNRPEVVSLMDDPGLSQFQRGERIYGFLYKWCNPRLCRVEEKFCTDKRRLGLPDSVRVSHDPFFEARQLKVEFSVATAEEFRNIAAHLQRVAGEPGLDEILRMS
jgi:hypothetical protein